MYNANIKKLNMGQSCTGGYKKDSIDFGMLNYIISGIYKIFLKIKMPMV